MLGPVRLTMKLGTRRRLVQNWRSPPLPWALRLEGVRLALALLACGPLADDRSWATGLAQAVSAARS